MSGGHSPGPQWASHRHLPFLNYCYDLTDPCGFQVWSQYHIKYDFKYCLSAIAIRKLWRKMSWLLTGPRADKAHQGAHIPSCVAGCVFNGDGLRWSRCLFEVDASSIKACQTLASPKEKPPVRAYTLFLILCNCEWSCYGHSCTTCIINMFSFLLGKLLGLELLGLKIGICLTLKEMASFPK